MKETNCSDNELHDLIKPTCEEQDDQYGTTRPQDEEKPYGGWAGFPGCGDGQDDFADYNQNEAGWGDW
jgi:hypothetical protein